MFDDHTRDPETSDVDGGRPDDAADHGSRVDPVTRPEQTAPDIHPAGRQMGPYDILEEIGRGGMGVVYKAFHRSLKRTVALKVLIAGEDASEDAIARFHREAESVARLGHHPNIVPVHDIGVQGKLHYFAMHFVPGLSLDKKLDQGPLAPRDAAFLIGRIARALQHAHDRGVLHRDVKPANVILQSAKEDTQAEPMLTDFGLARDVRSDSHLTASGTALGTPAYMPPEQARGDTKRIEAWSDVYSLGATLYECLTCRPPFDGDNVLDVLQAVLLKDPPPLGRAGPELPRDLETICRKCLEKDPSQRYATASELGDDLDRFVQGRPILAKPPSFPHRVVKLVRRNPVSSLALAGFVIALVTAAVWIGLAIRQKQRNAELATRNTEIRDAARKREQALVASAEQSASQQARLRERLERADRTVVGLVMQLAPVHDALWKARARSLVDPGAPSAVLSQKLPRLKKALATVPDDPVSKAAASAIQGWLLFLGSDRAGANTCFETARKLDPGLFWTDLFQGMTHISDYAALRPLPHVVGEDSELVIETVIEESAPARSAREAFEKLVARAARDRRDAPAADDTLDELVTGLEAIGKSDFETAVRGLGKAIDKPEWAWLRPVLLTVRGQEHYHLGAFDDALSDFLEVRELTGSVSASRWSAMAVTGRGIRKIARGEDSLPDLSQAVETLSKLLGPDGETPLYPVDLAYCQNKLSVVKESRGLDGRPGFQASIEACTAALAADPTNSQAANNRGLAHRGLGESLKRRGQDPREVYRKAIDDFSNALSLRPSAASTLSNRGNALCRLAEAEAARGSDPRVLFERAIRDHLGAAEIAPDRASIFNNLGNARTGLAEAGAVRKVDPAATLKSAVDAYGEALSIRAAYPEALVNRARALVLLGKRFRSDRKAALSFFEKARQDAARASALKPDLAPAHAQLGDVALELVRSGFETGEEARLALEEAVRHYSEALRAAPGARRSLNNRSVAYRALADLATGNGQDPLPLFDLAMKDLDAIVASDPDDAAALTNRGLLWLNVGVFRGARRIDPRPAFENAVQDLDRAVQINPALWQARVNRGIALEQTGRPGLAAAEYERVIDQIGDADPDVPALLERARKAAALPAWAASADLGVRLIGWGLYGEALAPLEKGMSLSRSAPPSERIAHVGLRISAAYSLACVYSLASEGKVGGSDPAGAQADGEKDALQGKALAALEEAFQLGCSWFSHARQDGDLAAIRKLPRFEAILRKYEK